MFINFTKMGGVVQPLKILISFLVTSLFSVTFLSAACTPKDVDMVGKYKIKNAIMTDNATPSEVATKAYVDEKTTELTIKDGNVGISMTDPRVKLHVFGDIFVQGQDLFFSIDPNDMDGNNDSISYDDNNEHAAVLGATGIYTFLSDTVKRASYTEPTAAISVKGALMSKVK